jgi:DNA-binding IclR family transcriptional regulator
MSDVKNKNKTVVKSMSILDLFRIHHLLSLNDIAQLANMPKTSVHRMVGSLTDMGFLVKDVEGNYSLGLIFLEFGQLVAERLDIKKMAKPFMLSLRDEVNEAINLTIKDGNEAIYIEKMDTDHPVRLFTKVGRRSPLYAGACSRIILSFLEERERESYINETDLKSIGIQTIIDKNELRAVLSQSRLDGYAISHSELENNTISVAAPIFNYTSKVVGGLSIAGPEVRFPGERLPTLITKVKETAAQISQELGYLG